MAASEILRLVLQADTGAAVKGLENVGKTADRELSRTDEKMKKVSAGLQKFGTGALLVGGAAAAGLIKAAGAASDLEQAVGGTEAVFGEVSGVIDRYAKGAAEAAGLSEREFREATTSIGGQLKRMTGDVDLAADASIELTQTAADLAATYGGTTADAVQALGAAFRGEADPAERFNLNLKIGAQNAKAVELGLAASTSEVDDNARAQALLALITEQSADAQGQFAREADTAAGSTQRAKAAFENASAELGSSMAPILADVADTAAGLASGFADLNERTGGLVAKIATFGTAGTIAVGAFATIAGKAIEMRSAFISAEGGMTRLGKATAGFAAIGATVTIAAIAYDQATKSSKQYAENVARLRDILNPVTKGQADLNEQLQEFIEIRLGEGSEESVRALNNLGISLEDIQTDIAAGRDALASLRDLDIDLGDLDVGKLDDTAMVAPLEAFASAAGVSTDAVKELIEWLEDLDNEAQDAARAELDLAISQGKLTQAQVDAVVAVVSLGAETDNYVGALDALFPKQEDTAAAIEKTGGAAEDTAEGFSSLEDAAKAVEEATKAVNDAFDELFGASISAEQAVIDANDAFHDLNGALQENGASLDITTEKGRANRESIIGAAEAALDHVSAMAEEGATAEEVNGALDLYRQGLIDTMTQHGFSEEEARAYIDTLGLTPENISTVVDLQGDAEAKRRLAEMQVLMNGLDGRVATLTVRTVREDGGVSVSANRFNRWGGVHAYAAGGITPAHITADELIKYGEPETGGEAFIPRRGDRSRSLSVLSTAAEWYNAKLIPMATGGLVNSAYGSLLRREDAAQYLLHNTPYGMNAMAANRNDEGVIDWGGVLDDLRPVADTYLELADAIGEAEAQQLALINLSEGDFNRVASEAIRQAADDAADAVERGEAIVERQDVLFKIGKTQTADYLSILRERLEGTEEYSNEWYRIWQEINQIEDEALREQEELANRRRELRASVSDPLALDLNAALPNQWLQGTAAGASVFRQNILGQISSAGEFAAGIQGLRSQGFDRDLLAQIAEGGVGNSGLVNMLSQVGPEFIEDAQRAAEQIGTTVADIIFGRQPGDGGAGTIIEGGVVINVNGATDVAAVAQEVRRELLLLGSRNGSVGLA